MKYAGADWLRGTMKSDMSPLGEKVADILGQAWRGIYHMDNSAIKKTNWSDTYIIEVNIYQGLATWDGHTLLALVVLCFDAKVRLSIISCNMQYIKLQFHQRLPPDKSTHGFESIPTLEKAVEQMRRFYSLEAEGHKEQEATLKEGNNVH